MIGFRMHPTRRLLQVLALLAGLVLSVIGIRFLVVPGAAAKFFGVGGADVYAHALHHVIAVRDLWLGLLAIALAMLREWRALALWFALGAGVCFADAAIVWSSAGPLRSLAFHAASGVFCGILAWLCRRRFVDNRGR